MPKTGQYGTGFEATTQVWSSPRSTVFRGREIRTGRDVAIKVFRGTEGPPEDRAVRQFVREARDFQRCDHEVFPRLLDFGVTGDGDCFLVSSWEEGESLRPDDGLDAPIVLFHLVRIADALDVLVRRGAAHLRVRPSNLCVQSSGRVKLLGLGTGWLFADQGDRSDEAVCRAPELGTRELDQEDLWRVDLYGLAATAAILLNAELKPIADQKPILRLGQQRAGLSEVDELEEVLRSSMHGLPGKRPDSLGELKRAMRRSLQQAFIDRDESHAPGMTDTDNRSVEDEIQLLPPPDVPEPTSESLLADSPSHTPEAIAQETPSPAGTVPHAPLTSQPSGGEPPIPELTNATERPPARESPGVGTEALHAASEGGASALSEMLPKEQESETLSDLGEFRDLLGPVQEESALESRTSGSQSVPTPPAQPPSGPSAGVGVPMAPPRPLSPATARQSEQAGNVLKDFRRRAQSLGMNRPPKAAASTPPPVPNARSPKKKPSALKRLATKIGGLTGLLLIAGVAWVYTAKPLPRERDEAVTAQVLNRSVLDAWSTAPSPRLDEPTQAPPERALDAPAQRPRRSTGLASARLEFSPARDVDYVAGEPARIRFAVADSPSLLRLRFHYVAGELGTPEILEPPIADNGSAEILLAASEHRNQELRFWIESIDESGSVRRFGSPELPKVVFPRSAVLQR